jgi:hypothetical protein
MRKRRQKPGTFVRIPLADGAFGYGRILKPPHSAFYNYRTALPDSDLDRIASNSVLFKIVVRYLPGSRWEFIGWKELESHLTEPVIRFTQDLGDVKKCTIFDAAENGRPATPEECVGLEASAVWDPHHVEGRLLDFFMGRPNVNVEFLKVRLR